MTNVEECGTKRKSNHTQAATTTTKTKNDYDCSIASTTVAAALLVNEFSQEEKIIGAKKAEGGKRKNSA